MGKHGIETDESGVFIDRGGLDDRNCVAAEALARDIEATR